MDYRWLPKLLGEPHEVERASNRRRFVAIHWDYYIATVRLKWIIALDEERITADTYDRAMRYINEAADRMESWLSTRPASYWLSNRRFDPDWHMRNHIAVVRQYLDGKLRR